MNEGESVANVLRKISNVLVSHTWVQVPLYVLLACSLNRLGARCVARMVRHLVLQI